MRSLLLLLAVVLLPGCTQGLYQWGGYNNHLYSYYQDPASAESFMIAMEQHINHLESKGIKPAPGLYAELGTLYLQKGDKKKALALYAKEKDAWPESNHMMSALIANLSSDKPETTALKE